jgi:putative ABC transport system permease protein
MSRQELMDFEKEYWNTTTPIGFVFAFGVILGSIVGIIIVYQILYSNVSEHLAEYATLKAMGYRHRYLLTVIFQEALILAILGYIPGFFITLAMYQTAQKATNLPIAMEKTRALMVLSLTILICFISGAIAVRKLQEAEPADIF